MEEIWHLRAFCGLISVHFFSPVFTHRCSTSSYLMSPNFLATTSPTVEMAALVFCPAWEMVSWVFLYLQEETSGKKNKKLHDALLAGVSKIEDKRQRTEKLQRELKGASSSPWLRSLNTSVRAQVGSFISVNHEKNVFPHSKNTTSTNVSINVLSHPSGRAETGQVQVTCYYGPLKNTLNQKASKYPLYDFFWQ